MKLDKLFVLGSFKFCQIGDEVQSILNLFMEQVGQGEKMKFIPSSLMRTIVGLLFFSLNLSTQSSLKVIAQSNSPNSDDGTDTLDQMTSWICSTSEDKILVEAKNDNTWKSIVEQNKWNCQPGLSDTSKGNLKFTCEPSEDGIISLVTITWLTGSDQNQQMGRWIHELADEYNMICSMAKVELWDNNI